MLRAIVSEGNEEFVRFSPAFRAVPIDPDLLILISDQKRRVLRAPLLYDLSLLINGKRTVSELLETLSLVPKSRGSPTVRRLRSVRSSRTV